MLERPAGRACASSWSWVHVGKWASRHHHHVIASHCSKTMQGWLCAIAWHMDERAPGQCVPSLRCVASADGVCCLCRCCSYLDLVLQDIMRLDNSARMNTPGKAAGNWAWR